MSDQVRLIPRVRAVIRVDGCPVKGGDTISKFYEVELPKAGRMPHAKGDTVADGAKEIQEMRMPAFEGERIKTSVWVRMYDRRIFTKQVFASTRKEGTFDTDSAFFFSQLKKAVANRNSNKVDLMTKALSNGVKDPQHSMGFKLTYFVNLELVSKGDEWHWVLRYNNTCISTNYKGENFLAGADKTGEVSQVSMEEFIKTVGIGNQFTQPAKYNTTTSENERELKAELSKLIEENKKKREEVRDIETLQEMI